MVNRPRVSVSRGPPHPIPSQWHDTDVFSHPPVGFLTLIRIAQKCHSFPPPSGSLRRGFALFCCYSSFSPTPFRKPCSAPWRLATCGQTAMLLKAQIRQEPCFSAWLSGAYWPVHETWTSRDMPHRDTGSSGTTDCMPLPDQMAIRVIEDACEAL